MIKGGEMGEAAMLLVVCITSFRCISHKLWCGSLLDVMRNACLFKGVFRISRNVDRRVSKLVIRSERTTDRSIVTLHVAFLPRDDDVNFAQARRVNRRT